MNTDKIIENVIGFEKWVMDNYNKYHKTQYPQSFKSEKEEEVLSDSNLK